ncbi:MAG: DUF485 domain-containing protein [Cytophagales bacterium]|nr:MAG: DUF485 domain-containing protein [Cytophagales bacterium]
MKKHEEILNSEEFQTLVKKRWSVSLTLTLIMLGIYFGYLLLIAFNKPFLATLISENLTLAIPIGLGIIVSAWAMTGIYVYWANNRYDNTVTEIKNKLNQK